MFCVPVSPLLSVVGNLDAESRLEALSSAMLCKGLEHRGFWDLQGPWNQSPSDPEGPESEDTVL